MFNILFSALLPSVLGGTEPPSNIGHGREGYYFGENGEYTWYAMAKAIAVSLSARGIGKDEPDAFNDEETEQVCTGVVFLLQRP